MENKSSSEHATIHDVARLAGVSYQTVSRVINNMPNVSPQTYEKVRQAIQELNYQPNRAARSLVTGRSNTIHVLAFDLYHVGMLPAMENTAYVNGFQLRITGLGGMLNKKDFAQRLGEIVSSQTDGIIFILPLLNVLDEDLRKLTRGIPYVILGSNLGYETNSVFIDQQHGTRLVVQHLLDLGHRRFAAISGPVDTNCDALIRYQTLLNILHENGIELQDHEIGNFTMDTGYEAANRILARTKDFTAMVCANDEMAIGAIHAIRKFGLRIPKDVSVVGFDDRNYAKYCEPPLTTIRQDMDALGVQGIQHLISLIKDPHAAPHQRMLYPKLMIRDSSAPPPNR